MARRDTIVWIAVPIFVACVFLLQPLFLEAADYSGNFGFRPAHPFERIALSIVPNFFLGIGKIHSAGHLYPPKNFPSGHNSKSNSSVLSVFKGRGANKNHAIFEILDAQGPLPISTLQRLLNKQKELEVTYYASLNKRIHALEEAGYITQTHPTSPSLTGFKTALYEVCAKFYLANFLNSNSPEDIVNKVTEPSATIILSDLINTVVPRKEK